MRTRTGRAFSLVEILVVLVVLMVLAALVLPIYLKGGKNSAGEKTEAPVQRAKAVECMTNLRQIRASYSMSLQMDEENRPQSFRDMNLPESMTRCPVGGQDYLFDPRTGRAQCPAPGHETH